MYTAKCDGQWLYNPQLNYQLINPKLVLADNSAGSFDFTMTKDHPLYNSVHEITSRVYVYRDGAQLWEGRPIKEKDDWYGNRTVTCEGALAYLNDTIQEQAEYHNNTVKEWLTTLINKHNAKVDVSRQFKIGTITVEEKLYRYTNYETTLGAINDKLLSRLTGHMRVRRSGSYNYIDYLKDYQHPSTQKIEFGRNLFDYSKNYDLQTIATAIIPLGSRLEESPIEALEAYTTVNSVNTDGTWHTKNTPYVQNKTAVDNFGWICKVVRWDDVTEPSNLYTKAKKYLTDFQYNEMSLEIKAIDFHLVDSQIEVLSLLDQVQVLSAPHNLDKVFPITKMEIPLNNAANTTLTLGALDYANTSLTHKNNAANQALLKKVEEMVPESTILKEAKEQASELIKSGALGGYVIIKENEIIITNNLNYTNRTARVWRWNQNGLAYSSTGYNGNFGSAAITSDGRIVADFITAGTMYADRIKGGTLSLGGKGTTYGDGSLKVYNSSDVLIGEFDHNGVKVYNGSIAGSSIKVGGVSTATTPGSLEIYNNRGVKIGTINADGLEMTYTDGKVVINGNGYQFYYNGTSINQNITRYYNYGSLFPPSGTQVGIQTFTYTTNATNLTARKTWESRITPMEFAAFYNNYAYSTTERARAVFNLNGFNINNVETNCRIIFSNQNGGSFEVSGSPSGTSHSLVFLISSGSFKVDGRNVAYDSSSSLRYKHDIELLTDETLDPHRLYKLTVKQFYFNEDVPVQYDDMKGQLLPGFIAEEVAELYPSAAIHNKDNPDEIESWDERRIIPGMLKLIQEQHEEINDLKTRLAKLEAVIEKMR